MSHNETEIINGNDMLDFCSASAACSVGEQVLLLRDAVRSLPSQPLKDLISIGVCFRCILRLFGFHMLISSSASVSTSTLVKVFEENKGLGGADVDCTSRERGSSVEQSFQEYGFMKKTCKLCMGILQFIYYDDSETLQVKHCAEDFATSIGEIVKREQHQFESFSVEVSLPPIILENEQAIWLYMKKKYGCESWLKEKFLSERTAKDFLKLSLIPHLEKLLDVKSDASSFRIRLTYSYSDPSTREDLKEKNADRKRRKTVNENVADGDIELDQGSVNSGIEHYDKKDGENDVSSSTSKETLEGGLNHLKLQLCKINQFCHLQVLCSRSPIFIGGRYLKYSRNVSQTRWIIDDERKGEASVEEIIGGNILPLCQGDSYKFHAAGREDIDVRMLGRGRPFLIEIQNARQIPTEMLIRETEIKINSVENLHVAVKNLKLVSSQGCSLMREGEAEKQKQYAALVWISRPLTEADMKIMLSIKDMQILQKTPIRVLHRRSPLEREKTIHWMRIQKIAGNSQYFLLHLCTQAGTYIKEFVHGDLGRTHPSVGSILGCRAEILQLDVTDVIMDCFQSE